MSPPPSKTLRKRAEVTRADTRAAPATPLTVLPWVDVLIRQKNDLDDRFRLRSHDGAYDRTLTSRDRNPIVTNLDGDIEVIDGSFLSVTFVELRSGKSYTLTHRIGSGPETVVLKDVPFAELTDHGQAPAARGSHRPLIYVSGRRREASDPSLAEHVSDYEVPANLVLPDIDVE